MGGDGKGVINLVLFSLTLIWSKLKLWMEKSLIEFEII